LSPNEYVFKIELHDDPTAENPEDTLRIKAKEKMNVLNNRTKLHTDKLIFVKCPGFKEI
jgi:hypothetical protein